MANKTTTATTTTTAQATTTTTAQATTLTDKAKAVRNKKKQEKEQETVHIPTPEELAEEMLRMACEKNPASAKKTTKKKTTAGYDPMDSTITFEIDGAELDGTTVSTTKKLATIPMPNIVYSHTHFEFWESVQTEILRIKITEYSVEFATINRKIEERDSGKATESEEIKLKVLKEAVKYCYARLAYHGLSLENISDPFEKLTAWYVTKKGLEGKNLKDVIKVLKANEKIFDKWLKDGLDIGQIIVTEDEKEQIKESRDVIADVFSDIFRGSKNCMPFNLTVAKKDLITFYKGSCKDFSGTKQSEKWLSRNLVIYAMCKVKSADKSEFGTK